MLVPPSLASSYEWASTRLARSIRATLQKISQQRLRALCIERGFGQHVTMHEEPNPHFAPLLYLTLNVG